MSTLPALNYLSDAARTQGEEKTAFEDLLAGLKQVPGAGVAEATLTISGGAVTPAGGSGGIFSIDTEAAAATDDLANIIQTNIPDGSLIMIRCANAARNVVVKHNAGGAGLLSLANSVDYTLDSTKKFLLLKRTGTLWEEVPPRVGSLTIAMAGAAINEAAASVAAHATTCDIWSGGNEITLTGGVVTFTALAAAPQAGAVRWVKSNAAHVLTNNAALAVQGGANFTLAANDWIRVEAITTTTFSILIFKADGTPVVSSSTVDTTGALKNLGFTATVVANALTFTATAKDGTALSASNKAQVDFRNATITTGQHNLVDITSALSLVISSGSTLGATSGVATRYYLGLINNAGTAELCAWNSITATGLFGVNEAQLVSTTAEGGAGGADSGGVIYSATARSNVPIRVIGYIDITEATAGTYATAPTLLVNMGPGVPRTGEIIQSLYSATGASATGSTTIPNDNTIPQNTEGDQYMSLAVTPTNAVNRLAIDAQAQISNGGGNRTIAALFQDSTAAALATTRGPAASNLMGPIPLHHDMAAGVTSSTTFKLRVGDSAGNTLTFNGEAGAQLYNGTANSCMRITEVCA